MCSLPCFGQGNKPPFTGDLIKLDTSNNVKAFPFDHKFVLQKDIANAKQIDNVQLYRIGYDKTGDRILKYDGRLIHTSVSTPDYIFPITEYVITKSSITVGVPALKPSRQFDILITKKGLSGDNYKKMIELNKKLIAFRPDASHFAMIEGADTVQFSDLFNTIKTSANAGLRKDREVFFHGINDVYEFITIPSKKFYQEATTDNNLRTANFLKIPELKQIQLNLPRISKQFADINMMENIKRSETFNKIFYGYIAMNGNLLNNEETDSYQIAERISNIKNSSLYFDTLYRSMNELVITDSILYKPIRSQIITIFDTLNYNKTYLETRLNSIDSILKNANSHEAEWITADTKAADLKTKGSRIFTLDVGIANIWATDLSNKTTYIPKLYYGVNIFFRSVDKNINRKTLPRSIDKPSKPKENRFLLSRRTIMQRLSLTAGFTIGSLDKENFDNFFGGSSLLLGPGYMVTRSFRLSTGVCFLKRSTLNPLVSTKKITSGYYLTASLDFDLLENLGKVTSLLLK